LAKKLGIRERKFSAIRHRPTMKVCEDERVLLIAIELLDLIDIEVVLDHGPPAVLSIHGKKQFQEVERQGEVSIATHDLRRFEATVVLPADVDERTVDTCFEGSKFVIEAAKRLFGRQASRLHLIS
jgi:HSP20 family molecular chaperone IbpA